MATFYVLPPRVCLEEQLTAMLGKLLPGLPVPIESWDVLVERLAEFAGWPDSVYLVPRDDIPFGETVEESLVRYFGAEPGDRVIEGSRSWTVSGVSAMAFAR